MSYEKKISQALEAIYISGILIIIGCIIILSLVPPVSRDALTHHLAIPKLYLEAGRIIEIPSLNFSYYPMNIDLLYLIPLYFGNDIIPKLIHFSFALMSSCLIFYYLNERLGRSFGYLGVLLFLSIPIIIKLSITAYVDLGLIFFSTLSLLFVIKWIESEYKIRYLVYAGFSGGIAAGTKYNGLITILILFLIIPYFYSKTSEENNQYKKGGKAIWFSILFLLSALLVFSPWTIRNYVWTGNPIYPLYNTFFESDTDADHENDEKNLNHFILRRIIYKESTLEIIAIPLRIFIQGRDNEPKYFDGVLTPFLLFLPIFALLKNEERNSIDNEIKLLFGFIILFLLMAFFSIDMRIRYIGPVIPPLTILSVIGLKKLSVMIYHFNPFPNCWRTILFFGLIFIMSVMLSWNFQYLKKQFEFVRPFEYLKGDISREKYIERYRSEYPIIKHINENLPSDAKFLRIFLGHRSYYSNREMVFDTSIFWKALKSYNKNNLIIMDLRNSNITHLLIRYDLFQKWINDNYDDRKKNQVYNLLQNHTELILEQNGFGLFQLTDPS